jgi:hypothetical protein
VHLENSERTGEGISQLRAQLVVVKQHYVVTNFVVVVEVLIVFTSGIRDDLFCLTFKDCISLCISNGNDCRFYAKAAREFL